jgi:hypothetical protein
MRLAFALTLGLIVACAPRPDAAPSRPPTPAVAAAPEVSPEPIAPPRCVVDAVPSVTWPALAVDPAARCRPVARGVSRDVQAEWFRAGPGGRLEITSGCDRLGDTIASLDVELSSGHGGTLHLARFERDPATGEHALLWIRYNHYQRDRPRDPGDLWQEEGIGTVEVLRGRVGAATMTALVDRVRAAAHLEIVEHEPPPKPGEIHLRGFGMSSRDFGVGLRLVDDAGHGLERFYAGYEGSGSTQAEGVRLDLAGAAVVDLLYDDAFAETLEPVPHDDAAARTLFAQWFADARGRDDEYGYWYLRERYVALATALGTHREIPALLERVAIDGEASVGRTRVLAINAIAALTGFDPRYGESGSSREPGVVAAEVLAACRAAR